MKSNHIPKLCLNCKSNYADTPYSKDLCLPCLKKFQYLSNSSFPFIFRLSTKFGIEVLVSIPQLPYEVLADE